MINCPKCGAENREGHILCRSCGQIISSQHSTTDLTSMYRSQSQRDSVGYKYGIPTTSSISYERQTSNPVIGGVLVIISALIGIFSWIFIGALSANLIPEYSEMIISCSVLFIILEIVAFFSGFLAIRRTNFAFAIIGSIIALLVGIFTFFYIGAILAFVGIILIAISHDEFP